jgi:hypothetical protein
MAWPVGSLTSRASRSAGVYLRLSTHGCLILKELTTLFSLREERIRKLLGELQGVFDGELVKESGAGEAIT